MLSLSYLQLKFYTDYPDAFFHCSGVLYEVVEVCVYNTYIKRAPMKDLDYLMYM
jgi:hypothetical protein